MKKNIQKYLLNYRMAFLHDLLWVAASLYLAYLLRFNFDGIPKEHYSILAMLIAISVPIQGTAFWLFGMYRGLWRFASTPDLLRILKAVFSGALCVIVIISFATRLEGVPRSVLFLYPLLLTGGLSLPRLLYRWYKDQRFSLHKEDTKRIIIIGAGRAGELLLRDLRHQDESQPVAFLDDDPGKQGFEIHGVPIFGTVKDLTLAVETFAADEIMIAIPSASKAEMQMIIQHCGTIDTPTRILPALRSMEDYQVSSSQLRPLAIGDLLGREAVQLDGNAIRAYLRNKTILVTGSGGSIGSELCRQIATLDPSRLILFDHGEFNLYSIDFELRKKFPGLDLITVLGDVKSLERVDWTFSKFRPQVIFHAAAYKHVPMIEINPAEGVRNNVLGTRQVAEVADKYGAECFVMVSTDKAVNPANVMGCTKRIAEIFCQNLAGRSKTKFITTRFGNVLGSAGSVVPLFEKQISEGGPVTVTHRDITRFFMTIPEAVSLILQAGSMGKGGEIFVLDMGDQILIRELAEQMIQLSGLIPGKDIEITYTGLRPGEKLYEELFHQNEHLGKTTHAKVQLAESREFSWTWLEQELEDLDQAALSRNVDKLLHHLQKIVPEYKGPKS